MATSSKTIACQQGSLGLPTLVLAAVLALLSSAQVGCNPTATPTDSLTVSGELKKFQGLKGKIDMAGGTAPIPVMNEAGKRIKAANPDIRITGAGGGSGVGVKKLGEGLVEIGNTGRALSDKEKNAHGLITFP